MPKTFSKPWYGIAIPCAIISFLGYGSQLLIFKKYPISKNQQQIFQIELILIWLTYYIAIKMKPGSPKAKFEPIENSKYKIWSNYCFKCKNNKPERAHHCKTCDTCVLALDHHCPWTMNCVGLNNFASFMRFLVSVIITTLTLFYHLLKKWYMLYLLRDTIRYRVTYLDIIILFIFTSLDFFVFFTISALFLRCFKNQFCKGMTQIETWEMDRIESLGLNNKLMPLLLSNVSKVFNVDFDNDEEWRDIGFKLFKRSKKMFSYSYINFPYDNGFFNNCEVFMGPFYTWLLPWGKSHIDCSVGFPKNDVALLDSTQEIKKSENELIDLVLSLPWPPDGIKNKSLEQESNEFINVIEKDEESSDEQNDVKKPSAYVDPRLKLKRNEWYNESGENLAYFGVEDDFESFNFESTSDDDNE